MSEINLNLKKNHFPAERFIKINFKNILCSVYTKIICEDIENEYILLHIQTANAISRGKKHLSHFQCGLDDVSQHVVPPEQKL